MRSWRYLTSDAVPAAEGLAFDEAMMLHYGRGESPPTSASLRLYTYRPHCALVGRYQSIEDEIDLDYCQAHGVEFGRRPTGGGAIIMGPDQLGVAITTSNASDLEPRQSLQQYARGVIAGLAALGVEARFRSKNDLEVGERKIAGLGLYADERGALLFHASVLVDLDVELMLRILKIPGAKLSDKAVERVGDRVTTVVGELGQSVAIGELRETFARGLAREMGIELAPAGLDSREHRRLDELVAGKYGDPDWIRQRSLRRDARGTAILKTPAGLVRIHVGVHGDSIKNVLLAGDFNALPPGLPRLESVLRWARADRRTIARRAEEYLDYTDLEVAPEAVAEAVWEATRRAMDLQQGGHPVRPQGSCYFPPAEPSGAPATATLETSEESNR